MLFTTLFYTFNWEIRLQVLTFSLLEGDMTSDDEYGVIDYFVCVLLCTPKQHPLLLQKLHTQKSSKAALTYIYNDIIIVLFVCNQKHTRKNAW